MEFEQKKRIGVVLLVDDNQEFVDSTRTILEMIHYRVVTAKDVASAKVALIKYKFTHLLLDLMLPDGSGLNVIEELSAEQLSKLSVTIITGHPIVKTLVKSLAGPNVNYLIKPITFKSLKATLEGDEVKPEAIPPSSPMQTENELSNALIGESEVMQSLKETINLVAETNANIMLLGESGVGKEVVASMIHERSNLSGELISTNCGALNRELITSELFGHEKGAFTGAVGRKIGVFESAHQGTLFLDEVTEMPLELQSNLLRALETRTISRVGGNDIIPAACRVISASNRSESEFADKRFLREDLYFRLAVFPIHIPALRERVGDIKLLAQFFLSEFCKQTGREYKISADVLNELESYSWPGNVRELRHTIHRAVIITPKTDTLLQLPEKWSSPFGKSESSKSEAFAIGTSLGDVEKEVINMTLNAFNGDKTKTSKVLGISTKTLYNKLHTYEKQATQ